MVSDSATFKIEKQVKYNESEEKYYIGNRRPRCNGSRWEPDWIEVNSDYAIDAIEKQI